MSWNIAVTFQNDALNAESRDAFAAAYGWTGAADPRGSTKAQFREYCMRQYLRQVVKGERVKADRAAQSSRVPDPDVT